PRTISVQFTVGSVTRSFVTSGHSYSADSSNASRHERRTYNPPGSLSINTRVVSTGVVLQTGEIVVEGLGRRLLGVFEEVLDYRSRLTDTIRTSVPQLPCASTRCQPAAIRSVFSERRDDDTRSEVGDARLVAGDV